MAEMLEKCTQLKLRLDGGEKIYVAICTPLYGGVGMVDFFMSLMETVIMLRSLGIGCEFFYLKYESLIQRGRNTLCGLALNKPEVTHVFFIDGDIKWHPYDVLKLLNNDKQLVGGLYPKKNIVFDRMFSIENILKIKDNKYNNGLTDEQIVKHHLVDYNLNFSENKKINTDGTMEVKYIATGFMMIKREVFDKMKELHPEWEYNDDIHSGKEKIPNLYAYFDCFIHEGRYLSEDWGFCERWRQCGGLVHADIMIPLTHIGTFNYEGRIMSTVRID
jgi:hypothetical protein